MEKEQIMKPHYYPLRKKGLRAYGLMVDVKFDVVGETKNAFVLKSNIGYHYLNKDRINILSYQGNRIRGRLPLGVYKKFMEVIDGHKNINPNNKNNKIFEKKEEKIN